jgi:hypothetical protein
VRAIYTSFLSAAGADWAGAPVQPATAYRHKQAGNLIGPVFPQVIGDSNTHMIVVNGWRAS